MSQEEITLIGSIDRIIYEQPETGFLIASFCEEQGKHAITIKGTIFNVSEEDLIQIKGNWENHRIYGKQLAVKEFMPVLPSSSIGIERYLVSEIPGIGRTTAKRIVKKFGEDTFRVIDESPDDLLEVRRFNKKQLKELLEVWEEKRAEREIITFLHQIGLSPSQTHKVSKHYGLSTIPLIKQNPYQLTELSGIGFLTADQIARELGFDTNSSERAIAGLLYLLKQVSSDGHTCYPRQLLLEKASKDLDIPSDLAESALQQLLQDRLVKSKVITFNEQTGMEMIAHPRLYYAEIKIAEHLYRILKSEAYTEFEDPEPLIASMEYKMKITLDPVQKEAVMEALKHKVLIITGGPGTGKTTIIRFILELVSSEIPTVALAAPTGRASKRLLETTGRKASTIHRLLGASKQGFQKNRDEPIEQELVIIDETSMIDTPLMQSLLDAIPSEARLILVGDVDQLPSVGPGAVLLNLIQSEVIPVVRLETIFRQAANSLITVNAHNVRKGNLLHIERPLPEKLLDFYFLREAEPEKIVSKIVTMATERIPKRFGFDPKTEVQVLTPMHRGVTGSINLNKQLQSTLNPSTEQVAHKDWVFKLGDKVIQQQNSYEKEVFNGDVGIITGCDSKTKLLYVAFDSNEVKYEADELEQLSLAYAISVHKSQGSEYPAVILPLTTHHYVMLQRNLLYTALTRGKKLVVLVGMENAVKMAIENASPSLRYTMLQSEFQQIWQETSLFSQEEDWEEELWEES